MKNILSLLSLGVLAVTLSSCDVGAGAYAGARPGYGYGRPNPGYYHNHPHGYYNNNGYYGHNHPNYYRRSSGVGVNTGVNARVAPLNVNSSTGLRLF
ncbi:hypothetical protein [Prosthecobacter sp.]|uniref:hypothetical protein n=1 Tax=Prosthecobacter sp. TaxID=1965333 RepID=UPI003784F4AC